MRASKETGKSITSPNSPQRLINTMNSGSNEDDARGSPRISKMSKIGEEEMSIDNAPAKQLYWNHDLLPVIN